MLARRLTILGCIYVLLAGSCVAAYHWRKHPNGTSSQQDNKVASPQTSFGMGWFLQSSAMVGTDGATLSGSNYQPDKDWYPVSLPTTVMGALVSQNYFDKDPLVGTNLSAVNANLFQEHPWWFVHAFTLAASPKTNTTRTWLKLSGLSYQAQIWLNGKQLSDTTVENESNAFTGGFRDYLLDVTDAVQTGANTLAIEVSRAVDAKQAFANYFVDWNPSAPDLNVGIIHGVRLEQTDTVRIDHPYLVTSKLSSSSADVTVYVDLTASAVAKGTVSGTLGQTPFTQDITLQPGNNTAAISFAVANPAIWWPWQYGTPNLSDLSLHFQDSNGTTSNVLTQKVGIRTISSRLITIAGRDPQRIFSVNGKDILIRGAAYTSDLFLNPNPTREADEMNYVRQLNLNALRFEGQFPDDHIYQLADQLGILTISGWSCCGAFQEGDAPLKPDQLELTSLSLRSVLYSLREHPSTLVWLNGSDKAPYPQTLAAYEKIESDLAITPAIPALSSATDLHGANQPSREDPAHPSGLKMDGPYWWEPPSYWEDVSTPGGAWGFASEVSPGPAIPVADSLSAFLPSDSFFDDSWSFHSPAGDIYTDMSSIQKVLHQYGVWKPNDQVAIAEMGQAEAYEAERAMFEAYGRYKYHNATGVIQWMLNSAWPSLYWHLYDYYLRPGGGFFGTRNALESLHIQYTYNDRMVSIVNSTQESYDHLTAEAQTYNLDGTKTWDSGQQPTSLAADGEHDLFKIPVPGNASSTYFVRLTLKNGDTEVSRQTYWLSTSLADGDNPDYSALQQQPHIDLKTSSSQTEKDGVITETVTLTNPSSAVDFFVHVGVKKDAGAEIAPITWDDNYVTLLPGETRVLTATFRKTDLQGSPPQIEIKSFADLT